MGTSQLFGLALLAVCLLVGVACDGGEGDLDERTKRDVARVLSGFFEAVANDRLDELDDYWSETCSPEQRERERDALRPVIEANRTMFAGREYTLRIDAKRFVVQPVGLSQLRIPLNQPPGVFQLFIDGQLMSGENSVLPAPRGGSITLLNEGGALRVANCTLFTDALDSAAAG